eukprot:CAMPEP_0118701066 /NCGR_PEP_ID=MMETSP0800-20121206/17003_1 /TAXON_ID=210618 ORGANISM="Striatella unipunctata, Strain CCMP2910" /NCGR_SAMPLE_ID=MMETSP0800 /ASSEMBLY_ACC=CAM_ASM_000638 /LENGTH=265 /DNA_ID=CAMNT_0006601863 /DNA_START=87 /DNA_END=884 /DNA_ORIENTATION=+
MLLQNTRNFEGLKNNGTRSGSESILFFSFDDSRHVTPEYKKLRGFEKVFLNPGEETRVSTNISLRDARYVGPHNDRHFILQDGMKFQVGIGPYADCRNNIGLCSEFINIDAGSDYEGACDIACKLWERSSCKWMTPEKCWSMCTLSNVPGSDGWGWNYVDCLEGILDNPQPPKGEICTIMTAYCRDVFKTSLPVVNMCSEKNNGIFGRIPVGDDVIYDLTATLATVISLLIVLSLCIRKNPPRTLSGTRKMAGGFETVNNNDLDE